MKNSTLGKKLQIKEGDSLLVLHAPEQFMELLIMQHHRISITAHHEIGAKFDWAIAYTYNKSDIDNYASIVVDSVKENGVLWLAYPKQSSGLKTDINRDKGWDVMQQVGWRPVSQISLDKVWSALRFKPGEPLVIKKTKPEDRQLTIPDDLRISLQAVPMAWDTFSAFAYTHKKEYINWITGAKKAETRQNRLEKAVAKIAKGEKYA